MTFSKGECFLCFVSCLRLISATFTYVFMLFWFMAWAERQYRCVLRANEMNGQALRLKRPQDHDMFKGEFFMYIWLCLCLVSAAFTYHFVTFSCLAWAHQTLHREDTQGSSAQDKIAPGLWNVRRWVLPVCWVMFMFTFIFSCVLLTTLLHIHDLL